MHAINLYTLSREVDDKILTLYERLLSDRDPSIKIHKKEVEIVKRIVEAFIANKADDFIYEDWFYSFTIPQISKEFDLLKISSDNNTIINIEIKSRQVDDLEKIKKQLCQNIHYLSHIAAEIFSFTYMQCNDSAFKIFRYDSNKLKESTIDELLECIKKIDKARDNYIEKLFRPTEYLISPFNKPKEFLNEKYYLSSPQEEVKQKIIENIHKGKSLLGINGAAGTGKSLLLYDIAKTLSKYYSVIIIHCGKLNEGHNELNTAFKKDFIINAKSIPQIMLTQYQIVCVDETQRLHSDQLTLLLKAFNEKESNILGIIFSYDPTQYLSVNEVERANCSILQNNPTFKEFNLSKKIRTNKELSHFIENIMDLAYKPNEKVQYKNIDIIYANDIDEFRKIRKFYENKDYTFITYTPGFGKDTSYLNKYKCRNSREYPNTHDVIGQEFDNVILVLDNYFIYNSKGKLEGREHPYKDYLFRQLFYQNITRTREKLCLIIHDNKELFEELLKIKENT